MAYNVNKSIFERTSANEAPTPPGERDMKPAAVKTQCDDFAACALDNLSAAVIAVDRDFTVTYANKAAIALAGTTKEQCLQSRCHTLFRMNSCNTENCQVVKALMHGVQCIGETTLHRQGGDMHVRITAVPIKDGSGQVTGALEYMTDITAEVQAKEICAAMCRAAGEGRFDGMPDISAVQGNYRAMLDSMHSAIGAVARPYQKALEFIENYAQGLHSDKLTEEFKGDFGRLRNAVNTCIDSLQYMRQEMGVLTRAARDGILSERCALGNVSGFYRRILQDVNDTLDGLGIPIGVASTCIERIARGDIPEKVGDDAFKGDFNDLKESLNACIEGLKGLVEADMVLNRMAVNDYTLAVSGQYLGIYADVARAVNLVQTRVKNMVRITLNVSRGNLDDLADLQKVRKRSENDEIVPAYIQIMENLSSLVADLNGLTHAAVDGRLDARADVSKLQGEYRRVMQGVNDTLDAFIGPLNVAAEYVDRIAKGDIPARITDIYRGDFNEIKNNLNQLIDAIDTLTADVTMLVKAALDGRLDVRADISRHHGEYRRFVQGINSTLDAVTGPLNVSAEYIERISKGEIPEPIRDEYRGDFNELKNHLNMLIDSMNTVTMIAQEVAGGNIEMEVKKRSSQDQLMRSIEMMVINLKTIIKGITEVTGTLTGASGELSAISDEMARNAVKMSERSNSVAASTEEMSINMSSVSTMTEQSTTNINSVASATEEMSSTIAEISRNAERARTVTQNAVNSVSISSEKVKELGSAAKDISKVIDVIVEIAEQTKLLALNATIEAARAGEAGKGFAVVANEVKELAKQTNMATDDIRQKIEAIQSSTSLTISQISEISRIIVNVSEIVTNIATSVEEQMVTTKSIARNISEATIGVNDSTKNITVAANVSRNISSDIGLLNEGISRIRDGSAKINSNSMSLVALAAQLKDMMMKFRL